MIYSVVLHEPGKPSRCVAKFSTQAEAEAYRTTCNAGLPRAKPPCPFYEVKGVNFLAGYVSRVPEPKTAMRKGLVGRKRRNGESIS